MTEMIEVKTAGLIGKALDYAVAVVEGHPLCEECCYGAYALIIGTGRGDLKEFSPSTDWSHGGPLIEKCRVWLEPPVGEFRWGAEVYGDNGALAGDSDGCDTALIAACRAIVAAKLGEVVSVPKELAP